MFLYERDLKNMFWKYYNNKGRAIRYQFECPARSGNIDLLTVERYQGLYQLNAFEFKLQDMKKVFLQAEENLKFVHKSWIVVPIEKKNLILDRYKNYLDERKYIGVIGVHTGGRYEILYQPKFQQDIQFSQEILGVCIN